MAAKFRLLQTITYMLFKILHKNISKCERNIFKLADKSINGCKSDLNNYIIDIQPKADTQINELIGQCPDLKLKDEFKYENLQANKDLPY